MLVKNCEVCNVEFQAKSLRSTTCSRECESKRYRIKKGIGITVFPNRNCEICDTEFTPKRKETITCSRKCISTLNNRKNAAIKNAKSIEGIEHEVPVCLICGYKSRALHTHIRESHQMSVAEYKEKFNVDDSALYHHSYTAQLSERAKGENNPGYQHGGKLSSFSKNFIGYDNLSEEDKNTEIKKVAKKAADSRDLNDSNTTKIEYYLKQGLTRDEAFDALSLRQTTFSLEMCIKRHGKELGYSVWKTRQDKWLDTINSKSDDELKEINRKKLDGIKSGYSKIANTFFKEVHNGIKDTDMYDIAKYCNLDDHIKEFMCYDKQNNKWYKPDFTAGNKIIEFYGDYWHGNPKKYKADEVRHMDAKTYQQIWDYDAEKERFLKDSGFDIMIVWESDVRRNPEDTLDRCIQFIKNENTKNT